MTLYMDLAAEVLTPKVFDERASTVEHEHYLYISLGTPGGWHRKIERCRDGSSKPNA